MNTWSCRELKNSGYTFDIQLLQMLEVLINTGNVTYGDVVRPISIQQVYFGRLTAHGYSQYGNITERISEHVLGTSDSYATKQQSVDSETKLQHSVLVP